MAQCEKGLTVKVGEFRTYHPGLGFNLRRIRRKQRRNKEGKVEICKETSEKDGGKEEGGEKIGN